MSSKPHTELAFIIDRALASPYGVPYDESHEAREALESLIEQLEAEGFTLELLRNGCEQALLLLDRDRFEDDPEAKVVRAVLRGALASNPASEPKPSLKAFAECDCEYHAAPPEPCGWCGASSNQEHSPASKPLAPPFNPSYVGPPDSPDSNQEREPKA